MNAVVEPSETIILELEGTFDIARARTDLRHIADRFNLPSLLRARAAAALTTIAELVLFKSHQPPGTLRLAFTVIGCDPPIAEFEFHAPFTHDIARNFVVAKWQLERACDEIAINEQGDDDLIIMRLWMARR